MNIKLEDIQSSINESVTQALKEDIGSGDITAELIPENQQAKAKVITREAGVLCGQAWVNEVYKQLDPQVIITWLAKDGDTLTPNQTLFELQGSARSLLTGERTALNFLQTLSATASSAARFKALIGDSSLKILDTRKTIPGLRLAQKYAVTCGGCHNHRIGLYDAFLIKENHIAACGSIEKAVSQAKQNHPNISVEVEVENLDEFQQAQHAGADIIMLDNFTLADIELAVSQKNAQCKIEVSGGLDEQSIPAIAKAGADFISIGALTKHCQALDLSFGITHIK
jgi:nicotinate-nucleotide pyrophosphorylase (carboxylating)